MPHAEGLSILMRILCHCWCINYINYRMHGATTKMLRCRYDKSSKIFHLSEDLQNKQRRGSGLSEYDGIVISCNTRNVTTTKLSWIHLMLSLWNGSKWLKVGYCRMFFFFLNVIEYSFTVSHGFLGFQERLVSIQLTYSLHGAESFLSS